MPIIILIATILLPPLGVALKHGLGQQFLISLVLTLIFYIPGLIRQLRLILWRTRRTGRGSTGRSPLPASGD